MNQEVTDPLSLDVEFYRWRDGWNEPYNYTSNGKVMVAYQDALSVPILSWIVIGAYTIALIILTPLIIIRRNKQPIKARNYILMLIMMYSYYLALLFAALRLAVGRWRYPCLFYSPVFSLLIPCAFMPNILRMWRLFFVVRLSKIKIRLAGFKQQLNSAIHTGKEKGMDLELQEYGDATVLQNQNLLLTASDKGFRNRLDQRLFNLQTLWVSNAFMLSVIFAVLLVHIIIWLIILFTAWDVKDVFDMQYACVSTVSLTVVLGIQIFFYLAIEMLLLFLLYLFKVNDKWGVRLEITVSQLLITVLLGVGVVLTGLTQYSKGERYFPAVFYGIVGFFFDIVWVNILPVIRSFNTNYNRYIEMEYTNEEVEEEEADSNSFPIMTVLKDDDFRFLFKQFCAASLVVETICFYEDNMSFSDPKNNTDNRALVHEAKQIIEKYCLDHSPLLLNLENKKNLLKPILALIEEYETRLLVEEQTSVVRERWVDPNLFHKIHIACLHDMQADIFPRFKNDKSYAQYLKKKEQFLKTKQIVGANEE